MKAFKIACITYCVLYVLTTFVGTWDIEHAMTQEFLAWKDKRHNWDPGYPSFYVHAESTPLIFLIKVKHGVQIAPLAGAGHTSYYLWFFGYKKPLTTSQEWVS